MTKAVWRWTVVTAAVLLTGWTMAMASRPSAPLRSAHSLPAVTAPDVVVVTSEGKLFHRADCEFIHGPARSESGEQAINEGYTACTRCLKH